MRIIYGVMILMFWIMFTIWHWISRWWWHRHTSFTQHTTSRMFGWNIWWLWLEFYAELCWQSHWACQYLDSKPRQSLALAWFSTKEVCLVDNLNNIQDLPCQHVFKDNKFSTHATVWRSWWYFNKSMIPNIVWYTGRDVSINPWSTILSDTMGMFPKDILLLMAIRN